MVKNQINKNQINKKKIYSKKRVLRGGVVDTTARIDEDGVLHSILNDAETLYPDTLKQKLLTPGECESWFINIKAHKNANKIINRATQKLILDENEELKNATPNARSAVKFCESKYQVRLNENLFGLEVGFVPEPPGSDRDRDLMDGDPADGDPANSYHAIGTTAYPLPLPDSSVTPLPSSPPDVGDSYVMVSIPDVNPDVTSIEENELSTQMDSTISQLRTLIVDGNSGHNYSLALKALEDIFYGLRQKLFTIIKTYSLQLKLYKQITEFFKRITFNIIPRNETRPPINNVVGFFIGIEKHSFTFFTSSVLFDSLNLFDTFVNSLMYAINTNYNVEPSSPNNKPIIIFNQPKDGNPSVGGDKQLFLVLTGVTPKYIDLMKKHSIKKPNLNMKCKLELSRFGLPENIFHHLEDNYNVFDTNDPPAASSLRYGGSKSRRKNINKSKVKTHRHRRGSRSKSKSRRRSHLRARKHKKNTYKRFK
jgi:hypothetical protein